MPNYYPKKPSQEETRKEIETSTNRYLLTLRKSATSTMIYMGGVNTWCIECQVIHDYPIANLVKIVYDEKCSLSGKFKRGTDTKGLMALMLTYIRSNYPFVNQITFEDYSTRECDDKEQIDLACFNYLLKGKTWYMDKMGATIFTEKDQADFNKATENFNKLKRKMSWEDYDSDIHFAHPLLPEEMKTIFHESNTWQEFFNNVLQKISKLKESPYDVRLPKDITKEVVDLSDMCRYMNPWIKNFVKKHANLDFTSIKFVMPIPNPMLPEVIYTLKPFIRNGGKYTRKYRKRRYAVDLR